jgi:hypothetical protein
VILCPEDKADSVARSSGLRIVVKSLFDLWIQNWIHTTDSGSNFKPLGPPTTTSNTALLAAGTKEATSKAARTILDVENMLQNDLS